MQTMKKNIKNTNLPNSLYLSLLLLSTQMISYRCRPTILIFGRSCHRSIGILMIISLTRMDQYHIECPFGHRSYAQISGDA